MSACRCACRSPVKLSRWVNKSFYTILPFRLYGPEPPNDALTSPQNIPVNGSSLLDVPSGFPHSPLLLQVDGTHDVRCHHDVVVMTKATTWRSGPGRHTSSCAFQIRFCAHNSWSSYAMHITSSILVLAAFSLAAAAGNHSQAW